jgi:hypothetical protein
MTEQLLSASGYLYRNGYRTLGEFTELFGFDPRQHSRYFRVYSNGIVWALPLFAEHCRNVFANRRMDAIAMGIR